MKVRQNWRHQCRILECRLEEANALVEAAQADLLRRNEYEGRMLKDMLVLEERVKNWRDLSTEQSRAITFMADRLAKYE